MTEMQIIAIYCFCDDFLKAKGHQDWQDLKRFRKTIETTFSQISTLLPKKIQAVTDAGFELKVMGFVIALAINFVFS